MIQARTSLRTLALVSLRLLLATTGTVAAAGAPAECRQFGDLPGHGSMWGGAVIDSGTAWWCLRADVVLDKEWSFPEGWDFKKSPMPAAMTINAARQTYAFDIDLQNRSIEAREPDKIGILARKDIAAPYRIHDGQVIVRGPQSIGISAGFIAGPARLHIRNVVQSGSQATVEEAAKRTSAVTLENLKIAAGGRGMQLVGAGNVVRNCTIEVDGNSAILVWGENSIIEGNTIIVHGKDGIDPPGTEAPIVLRNGNGSVVRQNHIVYTHFLSPKLPAAIKLINSENIQILDNQLEGFDAAVEEEKGVAR